MFLNSKQAVHVAFRMKASSVLHCYCSESVVDTSNYTDQSSSWGAERSFYSISSLSWNQTFHFNVHRSPLLNPILSQINLVHVATIYFFKYFHLPLGLPSYLLSSGHPTKILCAFYLSLTSYILVPKTAGFVKDENCVQSRRFFRLMRFLIRTTM
jgi:hypothetical protein